MFRIHHRSTDGSLGIAVVINIEKINQFALLVLLSSLRCTLNSGSLRLSFLIQIKFVSVGSPLPLYGGGSSRNVCDLYLGILSAPPSCKLF